MDSGSGVMYASMGLSAISSIVSAFGESAAIRAQGVYEQGIADTNATIADLESKQVLGQGDIVASRQNLKTQAVVGSVRAAQGASGTDVNSGSNAVVQAAVRGAGATDELTIRNNAARQAWGLKTQSLEDTFRGQFTRLTASSRANQSLLTGGLQAIEGPLAIESNYLRFARYMDRSVATGGAAGRPYPGAS